MPKQFTMARLHWEWKILRERQHLPAIFFSIICQRFLPDLPPENKCCNRGDIQRVAKKYFNYDNTRIVIVGKQEQILAGVKSIGHPIKFFDKNAKPVEENANATKKTDVTAAQVIDDYIERSGGKEALEKVLQ